MKPKKWTDVYPHGTKEGDEELEFFISLARNPKYQWRSVSAISKEANLPKERVEEIINKYYKKGMIFQNPKNEDQWGYWERVPEMLPKAQKSISKKDQDDRIGKLNKCGKDVCSDDSCSCDKVDFSNFDCSYSKDGHTFVVEIKDKNNLTAEKFIENLKAQFAKKKMQVGISSRGVGEPSQERLDKIEQMKLEILAKNPVGLMVPTPEGWKPVEERWHPPTDDEGCWIPLRPKTSIMTDEECLNAKASTSDWDLDM